MIIVHDFSPKDYSQKLVNWLCDSCMNFPAEGFVIG
ncbi:NAD(+) synthetase, partial [Francisella tularensis subsp. holarctica]|nr:NAD(+) synthetase [Francisella tularensis subsp. holarctica]